MKMKISKKFGLLGVIFFIFLLLIVQASALPVVFNGTVSVDGSLKSNVPIKVVTNFETRSTSSQSGGLYQMIIVGKENTSTVFKVYGISVKTVTQPKQVSHNEVDLSFSDSNRLDNEASCEYDEACLSRNCNSGHCCESGFSWCGSSCARTCSSGSATYRRSWSASVTLDSVSTDEASLVNVSNNSGLLISKIGFQSLKNRTNVKFSFSPLETGIYNKSKLFYAGEELDYSHLSPTDFSKVYVYFKVNNSWLAENNIDLNTVFVSYKSSKTNSWNEVGLDIVSKDSSSTSFRYFFDDELPKKVLLIADSVVKNNSSEKPFVNTTNSTSTYSNEIIVKNDSSVKNIKDEIAIFVSGILKDVVDKTTIKSDGTPCHCWIWILVLIAFLVMFSYLLYKTLFLFSKPYRLVIFHKRSIKHYRAGKYKNAVKYQRRHKKARSKLRH